MVREFLAMKTAQAVRRRRAAGSLCSRLCQQRLLGALRPRRGHRPGRGAAAVRRGHGLPVRIQLGDVTYYFTYLGRRPARPYAPIFKPVTHRLECARARCTAPLEAWARFGTRGSPTRISPAALCGVPRRRPVHPARRRASGYLAELDGLLGDWAHEQLLPLPVHGQDRPSVHRVGRGPRAVESVDYPVDGGPRRERPDAPAHGSRPRSGQCLLFATVQEVGRDWRTRSRPPDRDNSAAAASGPGWFETGGDPRASTWSATAVSADTLKPFTNEEFEADAAQVLDIQHDTRGTFRTAARWRVSPVQGLTKPCSVAAGTVAIR